MIPKKMSFYWGNKTMSWMRFMTLKSFRVLNPDWNMVLYLDNSEKNNNKAWKEPTFQDFFCFYGQDSLEKINELNIEIRNWKPDDKLGFDFKKMTPSQIGDSFKWGLMASEAGFYSDLDILYIKPIEEYYNQVKDYDTILCYGLGYFSIGFLGSSGNNKFFLDLFKNSFKTFDINKYQTAGVLNIYDWLKKIVNIKNRPNNQIDFWKILQDKYSLNNYNNSMELLYPWHFNQMDEVFFKLHNKVPRNCFGIHWYGGNKISKHFNNILNEDNYKEYNNTFCYFTDKYVLK